MKDSNYFKFDLYTISIPLVMVLICWLIYWMEIRFNLNLNEYGIRPGRASGLRGIIAGPFIHGNVPHLWSNSLPILILGTALGYFYRKVSWKILIIGLLLTGLMTWIIGRPSYHIGASGVVYFLASFLFFKGVFTKHYRLIALSLIIAFFYGSMVWYALPIEEGVSWEGHLSGGVVGLIVAIVTRNELPEKRVYIWETNQYKEELDPFMQQFDENGNFFELPDEEE